MTSESPTGDRAGSGPTRDPRTIVTHHAFRLDPDILGRPLAGPGRRLLGMFVDLFVLGLLFPLREVVSALTGGIIDLLVALTVAWLLFHLSSSRSQGQVPSRGIRWLLRGTALVVALVGIARFSTGGGGNGDPEASPVASADSADIFAVVETLQRMPETSDAVIDIDGRTGSTASGTRDVGDRAVAGFDAVLDRYGRALVAGDAAAADSLRPLLRTAVSGVEIEELREENEELEDEIDEMEDEVDELEDELEEARPPPGFVDRTVTLLTEDLGIGLGWLGIYFTLFLTLWDGRTPGKRLLGMKVMQLNGEPLGWWASFERFGGYAAGLATGLMGFAEVFRDPNRQAIHDKIASTVVVRTRGAQYEAWKSWMQNRSGSGPHGPGDTGYGGAEGPYPHLDADR